jgi:hypothetical protein
MAGQVTTIWVSGTTVPVKFVPDNDMTLVGVSQAGGGQSVLSTDPNLDLAAWFASATDLVSEQVLFQIYNSSQKTLPEIQLRKGRSYYLWVDSSPAVVFMTWLPT